MAFQLRRGTEDERVAFTPVIGEPVYTTDTKALYIGDGITAGGLAVTSTLFNLSDVDLNAYLPVAATQVSCVSELVTVSTNGDHYLQVGQRFKIAVEGYPTASGEFVTTAILASDQFSYTAVGSPNFLTNGTVDSVTPYGVDAPDGSALIWNASSGFWRAGSFADLSGFSVTAPTANQILTYDAVDSDWVNTDHTLENISNVTVTAPSIGDVPTWTGSGWENVASGFVAGLDDLTDVDLTTAAPVAGDTLIFDGTNYVPGLASATGTDFGELQDTAFTSLTTGQVAVSAGGLWVNQDFSLGNLTDVSVASTPLDQAAFVYDLGANRWTNGEPSSPVPLIADQPPTERLTGAILRNGDQWWSSLNGAFYIYHDGSWVQTGGASTGGGSVRGDGGDFETGEVDAVFAYDIYGGGNFETGVADEPWEDLALDNGADGGVFT